MQPSRWDSESEQPLAGKLSALQCSAETERKSSFLKGRGMNCYSMQWHWSYVEDIVEDSRYISRLQISCRKQYFLLEVNTWLCLTSLFCGQWTTEMILLLFVFNIHIASRLSFPPTDWFLGICIQNSDDVVSPGNISFMHPSGAEGAHWRFWKKKKKDWFSISLRLQSLLLFFFVSCCRKLHWLPAPVWLNANWILRLSENTFCWRSERRVSEGERGGVLARRPSKDCDGLVVQQIKQHTKRTQFAQITVRERST